MKKQNLLLSGIQFCYLSAFAIYFNFLVLFMKDYGYTAIECGIVQALTACVTFVLGPIVGHLIDTKIGYKKFLFTGLLMTACTAFLVPLTIQYVLIAMVTIVLHSAFVRQFSTPIDAFTLVMRTQSRDVNYGLTRGIGSLGEGLAALVMGYVIAQCGFFILFVVHALLMFIAAIASLFLPDIEVKEKKEEVLRFKEVIQLLIKNKLYTSFLISVVFLNIGLKVISIFSGLIVGQLGGGSESLGSIMFICGLFELPTFIAITYLAKYIPLKYLYLIGIGTFAIGAGFGTVATTIVQFMIGRTLTSMTYAIYISILVEYIGALLPTKLYTIGMAIIAASAGSIAHIFSSLIGGIIIDYFGMQVMFFLLIAMGIMTVIAFIPHLINKKESIEGEIK